MESRDPLTTMYRAECMLALWMLHLVRMHGLSVLVRGVGAHATVALILIPRCVVCSGRCKQAKDAPRPVEFIDADRLGVLLSPDISAQLRASGGSGSVR